MMTWFGFFHNLFGCLYVNSAGASLKGQFLNHLDYSSDLSGFLQIALFKTVEMSSFSFI